MNKEKIIRQYRNLLEENQSIEEIDRDIFHNFYNNWQKKKKKKKLGYSFFFVSLFCFTLVLFPLFSIFIKQIFSSDDFFNPLPRAEVLQFSSYNYDQNAIGFLPTRGNVVVIEEQFDYDSLSNWFSSKDDLTFSVTEKEQNEYILEIPKLDIYQAKVAVGGENLTQNLVQYQDTPGPGEYGAPIIFGHSTLRQFYNPKVENSSRYKSLFSTIMTLEEGDEIFLIKNGTRFIYKVTFKENIKPDDRYILSQRYDLKYLKLVTCTPEGTFLMRGIVSAQLVGSQLE